MRIVVGALIIILAALSGASVALFVRPSTGEIGPVDAVVQLSGEDRRRDVAVELVEGGGARVLVLSLGPASNCRSGLPYEVICFEPEPVNTRGEAAAIGRIVEARGWEEIAVVTSTYHVTRARRTVEYCTDANVRMVDAGSDFSTARQQLRTIAREWVGLAGGLVFTPDC